MHVQTLSLTKLKHLELPIFMSYAMHCGRWKDKENFRGCHFGGGTWMNLDETTTDENCYFDSSSWYITSPSMHNNVANLNITHCMRIYFNKRHCMLSLVQQSRSHSHKMLPCSLVLTIKQAMATNFEFNQLPFFKMQVWHLCTTQAQCFSLSTPSEIHIYDFAGCLVLSNIHLNIAQFRLTEMRSHLVFQIANHRLQSFQFAHWIWFGLQGFPAIPLWMNVSFGLCNLKSQPVSGLQGFCGLSFCQLVFQFAVNFAAGWNRSEFTLDRSELKPPETKH